MSHSILRSAVRRLAALLAVASAGAAFGQAPVAVDDAYTARSGFLLTVEAPGVLENDHDGGGEPPPPPTAVAHLVSDVAHGTLALSGDGSFDYTSTSGYVGPDTFTYYFADGTATSNTATVTLTVAGCEVGALPTQWICWAENAYLAKAAELNLSTVLESFEDDVAWAIARSPGTAPSVTSRGVTWASNFSFNNITTGPGPARTGSWAVFSDPHGDQSGAPGDRIYDGFTGTAASPGSLLGVGGWLVGSQLGARVDLIITFDGGATTTPGFPDSSLTYDHKFFGFIDTAGFSSFEVVETDGTVNQPYFVFGDDFSFALAGSDGTPPRVLEIASWEDTGDGVISEGEVTGVAITELMVRFSEAVRDLPGDSDPDDVTNPANY
ncbi:MAG TPA: Ig-like domain-containing protein, partial [Candidatus Sulfomarinibacteraceae bacterium]|nr:Ig-like domain-containing protein [Candidatus Sulfomarinibacteraceae bacterium]